MITLCLAFPVLMGDKDGGWNPSRKVIACIWCVLVDSIYIVPMVL
jgi:hypothetical protein